VDGLTFGVFSFQVCQGTIDWFVSKDVNFLFLNCGFWDLLDYLLLSLTNFQFLI